MIEIGGMPILWHIMKEYSHYGYNDFIICAGYKQHMIKHGDVFVVLPGGIGTLDEWISTLAVMTIGDDDRRPIIVADLDGMYANTIQQINTIEHTPFARDKRLSITTITHTTDQLLDQLSKSTHHNPPF